MSSLWLPKPLVKTMLRRFLEEDLGFTDLTTALLIPEGLKAEGLVVAKESGVAAGVEEACILAELLDLKVEPKKRDGEKFEKGDILLKVEGEARSILAVERTLLNLLSRMSGIATATRRIVEVVERGGGNVRVAATRKTAPGLRYFDKKAVELGGGDTHRFRLEDMVLIKDNHIALVGSIGEAVRTARAKAGFTVKIEVEASSPEEALEAAKAGADIVMLDNFTVEEVEKTVELLEKEGVRSRVVLEVSGGIDEANVADYASRGVDIVSLGMLTHSVKAVDLSLEVKPVERLP